MQILQKPLQRKEVEVADLPDLDLYMDQITTLFADKTQEPEGLLTKTMINNYSKDGLIKPIKGKKYSKEHILQMLLIYWLKQTSSSRSKVSCKVWAYRRKKNSIPNKSGKIFTLVI